MSDQTTYLHELRELVRDFVNARQWKRFHSPKNLSMSLAIEAAELMEHFQWLTIDQSRQTTADAQRRNDIAEEMADVFCYLLDVGVRLREATDDQRSLTVAFEKSVRQAFLEFYTCNRLQLDGVAIGFADDLFCELLN